MELNLDQKTYLLFKSVCRTFEEQGYKPEDAENKAMQMLLNSYDQYFTLLAKLKDLTDTFKATRIGTSRVY